MLTKIYNSVFKSATPQIIENLPRNELQEDNNENFNNEAQDNPQNNGNEIQQQNPIPHQEPREAREWHTDKRCIQIPRASVQDALECRYVRRHGTVLVVCVETFFILRARMFMHQSKIQSWKQ